MLKGIKLKLNPKDVYDCLLICSEAFKTGVHPLSRKPLDTSLDGLCRVFESTMIDYFNSTGGDAGADLRGLFILIYGVEHAGDPFATLGASYYHHKLNYEVRAIESFYIAQYVKRNYIKD